VSKVAYLAKDPVNATKEVANLAREVPIPAREVPIPTREVPIPAREVPIQARAAAKQATDFSESSLPSFLSFFTQSGREGKKGICCCEE
jgi:hypothetical protein